MIVDSQILYSEDFLELADALQAFLDQIADKDNRYQLVKKLYEDLQQLVSTEAFFSRRPYHIYMGAASVRCFLFDQWVFQKSYKANATCIMEFVQRIRKEYSPAKHPLVTEKEIHEMMQRVDDRYDYFYKVLNGDTIGIYLINNGHIDCNAQFVTRVTSEQKKYNSIYMYSPKFPETRSPIYTLVCGIGNILRVHACGAAEDTPEAFMPLVLRAGYAPHTPEANNFFQECFADSLVAPLDINAFNLQNLDANNDLDNKAFYMYAVLHSIKKSGQPRDGISQPRIDEFLQQEAHS